MDKEIIDWAIVADVKQKNWCVIPSETGTGIVIVNRVEMVLPRARSILHIPRRLGQVRGSHPRRREI